MNDLLQRINSFSDQLTGHRPPERPNTAKDFRAWYLHTQASACRRTADAYWHLVHGGYANESMILIRNLMERLFHSLYAGKELGNAAVLSYLERRQHLRNLARIHDTSPPTDEVQRMLESEKQKLAEAKWLLNGESPKGLTLLQIAQAVGLEEIYRDCYAHFSAYTHGGCLPISDWQDGSKQAFAHWLAASAPTYTAFEYYCASGEPIDREIARQRRSLLDEIKASTFGERKATPDPN